MTETKRYTGLAHWEQQGHAERILEDYRKEGIAKPDICIRVIVGYNGPTLEQVRSAVIVITNERLLRWLSDPKTTVGQSEAVPESIRELAASRLPPKLVRSEKARQEGLSTFELLSMR